jgi:hypothetical protein
MKNSVLTIASLIVLSGGLTSCTKDYNCVCKDSAGVETKGIVNATNKTQAREHCDARGIKGNCEIQ